MLRNHADKHPPGRRRELSRRDRIERGDVVVCHFSGEIVEQQSKMTGSHVDHLAQPPFDRVQFGRIGKVNIESRAESEDKLQPVVGARLHQRRNPGQFVGVVAFPPNGAMLEIVFW